LFLEGCSIGEPQKDASASTTCKAGAYGELCESLGQQRSKFPYLADAEVEQGIFISPQIRLSYV